MVTLIEDYSQKIQRKEGDKKQVNLDLIDKLIEESERLQKANKSSSEELDTIHTSPIPKIQIVQESNVHASRPDFEPSETLKNNEDLVIKLIAEADRLQKENARLKAIERRRTSSESSASSSDNEHPIKLGFTFETLIENLMISKDLDISTPWAKFA